MKKTRLIIILAVLGVISVSGCQDSSRTDSSASRRWQRTVNQAKLQAAQQGLQEGRLMYAQRILTECQSQAEPESRYAEQVSQMLAQIQTENNRYAKAGQEITSIEDMAY
jgi:outer membrane protein assembly factor BamD (BamD/ComL family)